MIVHHFEETIGGRAYQVEVTAVSDRWRAQLRRGPGVPTAMMPFYGPTPDEAARLLLQWLSNDVFTLDTQYKGLISNPNIGND